MGREDKTKENGKENGDKLCYVKTTKRLKRQIVISYNKINTKLNL